MPRSGHGSARRDDRSFYINSGASTRGTLAADDIVAVDFNGALVEGGARPPLEFYLHAEIYRARADVHAIMHTHPRWSTLLTMVGAGYQVVYAQGALLAGVGVFDSPLSFSSKYGSDQLTAPAWDPAMNALATSAVVFLYHHHHIYFYICSTALAPARLQSPA